MPSPGDFQERNQTLQQRLEQLKEGL